MAKKKRKHFIKLNNKVRELFGNLPFDEGVVTLSDDELLELVLLLDLKVSALDRDENIRALRRVWSEGDFGLRSDIVSHLSGKKPLPMPDNAIESMDKVEKILELLHEFDCNREEEQAVLESFIDLRPVKITKDKIRTKLGYIRLQKRVKSLEAKLEVEFSSSNEMEFYHSYLFDFSEFSFSKTLLTHSEALDMTALLTKDDDELVVVWDKMKAELIEEKSQTVQQFLLTLKAHRYLTEDDAYKFIRKLPIDGDLYHNPIESEFISGILAKIDTECYLIESGEHFVVEKPMTTELFGREVAYRISASYAKNLIYSTIWRGDVLTIADDIHSLDETMRAHFEANVSEMFAELSTLASGLDIDDTVLEKQIAQFFEPQLISSGNLKIKEKTRRRVLYHFSEYLKPLKEKRMREELLAKTIRDFKNLFPLARSLKRKITFHAGPTNSGKTYSAMERLKSATTGYYLAPLRLLALEGYENIKNSGIPSSLITGEEEIIDEESTHISSTIEMLNSDVDVDVCVIDEIQMINDRDRGWAWANALIGAPAKELILTGSADAVRAISEIAEYLGEELEIIYFERKNPLEVMSKATALKDIEEKTAIVAFSRKEVLSYRQRLASKYSVSVIYGNLSPEVRREEARKFRDGESDVLVATDAIAMGLNLPIKTILFARDNKFDGLRRRELTANEVLQISGRAGRYGIEEHGYVGTLDEGALKTIADRFHTTLPEIELPFSVMASMDHVLLIGEILETDDLLEILTFFADNMEFDGPFRAANIDSMLEIATIVGQYDLELRSRYHLACAPVSINSPYIESVFRRYLGLLEKDQTVPYIPPRELPPYAHTNEELLNAEDRVKEVSLYLWLSFRFSEQFTQTTQAIEARERLNRFIETSLHKGDFVKRCTRCNKTLDFSYRFSVCQKCYDKGKRGVRTRSDSTHSSYRSRKRR